VCRGTSLVGAANLSPVTKLVAGTGAVSRYKLSRRQEFITVQDFNCVQMRMSGCNGHYEFVLGAGAKAKSVTSPLIIPSVLGGRSHCFFRFFVMTLKVDIRKDQYYLFLNKLIEGPLLSREQ
jgi:hypothetical protein